MLVSGVEYLHFNGSWVDPKEFPKNSFVNGTTIYEVIRVINGIPLFLEDHLDRLTTSASLINLNLWLGINDIKQTILQLIIKHKIRIGNIQILLNQLPDLTEKNFVCRFIPTHYPDPKYYTLGVNSILFKAVRDNPNAKRINQSLREATDLAIKKHKVYEVILTDENDFITEGSRSNIFFIKNQSLITSSNDKVLAGVTRKKIFEICEQNEIKITTQNIHSNKLRFFDAAFFTGTSPKVLPINCIGQTKFDPSNILLRRLISLYDQEIEGYISSFAV